MQEDDARQADQLDFVPQLMWFLSLKSPRWFVEVDDNLLAIFNQFARKRRDSRLRGHSRAREFYN